MQVRSILCSTIARKCCAQRISRIAKWKLAQQLSPRHQLHQRHQNHCHHHRTTTGQTPAKEGAAKEGIAALGWCLGASSQTVTWAVLLQNALHPCKTVLPAAAKLKGNVRTRLETSPFTSVKHAQTLTVALVATSTAHAKTAATLHQRQRQHRPS